MKKLIIICALFIAGNTAFTQDMGAAQTRADEKTNKMITQLALDAEQTEKVKNLNLGIEQKLEAINTNESFTPEQKAEQIKMNKDAEKLMLKNILTESQYSQFDKESKLPQASETKNASKANINTSRSNVKVQD